MNWAGDSNKPTGQSAPDMSTHLTVLPNELIIELIRTMKPIDRIQTAFKLPELYMSGSFNLFVDDAIQQLSYPTWEVVSEEEEEARASLLLHGVANPEVTLEQIGQMLEIYDETARAKGHGRRIFLDSAFPDNAPDGIPPDERDQRIAMTPLHVAIKARRLEVVTYLIRRRADVYRHCLCGGHGLKPFQYALSPTLGPADRMLEDIAIELAPSSGVLAFGRGFHLSEELEYAIFAGMDRLALLLVDLFENHENLYHESPILQAHRPMVIWHAINSPYPMRRLLTALLQDPNYRQSVAGQHTMIDCTIARGNIENACIVLYWELRLRTPEHERAAESVALLCCSDDNFPMVKALAGVMKLCGYQAGLRRLVRFSMLAGQHSMNIRQWLVQHTDAGDGEALAYAICLRDRATAEQLRHKFQEAGRPIDQPLFEGPAHVSLARYQRGWRETPLAMALLHRNYHEAAHLLNAGADLGRVPHSILHDVAHDQASYEAGLIHDPVHFVYQTPPHPDGTMPTEAEAHEALRYVFSRMEAAGAAKVSASERPMLIARTVSELYAGQDIEAMSPEERRLWGGQWTVSEIYYHEVIIFMRAEIRKALERTGGSWQVPSH